MGHGLGVVDLAVIVAVMLGVTWMGHRLSGAVQSQTAFFMADGSLPWWAVSASIIATLVSAVTFVSVPANVFSPDGDLKYFQVILGLALGKVAVGLLLARPFYESQQPRTSYEYIGARLDPMTGELSMFLGLVLTVINSGVKLLTASLVLDVITGWGIPSCAAFVVFISVIWSALAGIKTVIWTDFLLFVLFALGAVFAVMFIGFSVEISIAEAVRYLDDQAKLVLVDLSLDPEKRYTLWAAVIGGIALNIATGSMQGTWQRVKACRSVGDAEKAYHFAALFYVMHLVILAIGLGLFMFYAEQPLPAEAAAAVSEAPDRIFPYFIITEIPVGISGLFIAAIFAAAISTLDSALAEASDLAITHGYARVRKHASERHYVTASRWAMALWGGVFFFAAVFFSRFQGEGLLDLTFKLPNYVYGPMLGAIVLARIGIGKLPTVLVGFVVAVGMTLWLSDLGIAFFWWCPTAGLTMILVVVALERARSDSVRPEWTGVAQP